MLKKTILSIAAAGILAIGALSLAPAPAKARADADIESMFSLKEGSVYYNRASEQCRFLEFANADTCMADTAGL